jgi:hypothetical protein
MAMKTKSKKVARPEPLPEKELVLAAKFFTVSNLGQPLPGDRFSPDKARTVAAVERAYFMCAQAHESEGLSIQPEYKSWVREFTKRDPHFMAEWAKEAATITDIASVRPAPATVGAP